MGYNINSFDVSKRKHEGEHDKHGNHNYEAAPHFPVVIHCHPVHNDQSNLHGSNELMILTSPPMRPYVAGVAPTEAILLQKVEKTRPPILT